MLKNLQYIMKRRSLKYITVKGKLSKYSVKSDNDQVYFLTKVQKTSLLGYFLLLPVGNEYSLVKLLRSEWELVLALDYCNRIKTDTIK